MLPLLAATGHHMALAVIGPYSPSTGTLYCPWRNSTAALVSFPVDAVHRETGVEVAAGVQGYLRPLHCHVVVAGLEVAVVVRGVSADAWDADQKMSQQRLHGG